MQFHGAREGNGGATVFQSSTGAFVANEMQTGYLELNAFANSAGSSYPWMTFWASAVVPTADEDRPFSVAFLPLISY